MCLIEIGDRVRVRKPDEKVDQEVSFSLYYPVS
jgi:hypothetical protein